MEIGTIYNALATMKQMTVALLHKKNTSLFSDILITINICLYNLKQIFKKA